MDVRKACWRASMSGTQATCNSFTLALALSAAIEAQVDVINLSLAGPADPLRTQLVARALEAGIIVKSRPGSAPTKACRAPFRDLRG